MEKHAIEGLMITAMNSIKDMIDVDTIIGDPIETSNNTIIVPISKVGFGFAAGGSEFRGETVNEYSRKDKDEEIQYRLPFGGGSGAGVSISPVAFLVIQENSVKLLPINHSSVVDKLIDYIPDLMEKVNIVLNKKANEKQEEEKKTEVPNEENKKNREHKMEETIKSEADISNIKAKPRRSKEKQKNVELDYEIEYDETQEEKPTDVKYINEEEYDE